MSSGHSLPQILSSSGRGFDRCSAISAKEGHSHLDFEYHTRENRGYTSPNSLADNNEHPPHTDTHSHSHILNRFIYPRGFIRLGVLGLGVVGLDVLGMGLLGLGL